MLSSAQMRLARLALLIFIITLLAINESMAIVSKGTTTNWGTSSGWSPSGEPNLTFWNGSKDTQVFHNKSKSGSLTITNRNDLTIKSGATVTINGNLSLGYRGYIIVDAGGTLNVTGNVSTASESRFNNNGTTNIGGSFSMATSATSHLLGGEMNIGGNFSGTGNVSATISGEMNVTGQFSLSSNARASGNGQVSWGSYNIFACGFSFLTCNSGSNRGNGCGATNPPAGGIDLLTCSNIALPVHFLSFEGEVDGDDVSLEWSTAFEESNDYFSIERSKFGFEWNEEAQVGGVGYASSPTQYSWQSSEAKGGLYRIKQTDFDGGYMYSSIKMVTPNTGNRLHAIPNPTDGEVVLSFTGEEDEQHPYEIISADGSTVAEGVAIGSATLDLSDQPSGLYMVRASFAKSIETRRLFIQ